jgi:hypothetical protein
MTLDDLKKIDTERASVDSQAKSLKYYESRLAGYRNGDHSLVEIMYDVHKGDQYNTPRVMSKALNEAINHFKIDILRLAEIGLEAEARTLTTRAAALKAQLDAYLTEPEKEPT